MMVLYGYWQQWYGTVRCYTAGGRTIISSAPAISVKGKITVTLEVYKALLPALPRDDQYG